MPLPPLPRLTLRDRLRAVGRAVWFATAISISALDVIRQGSRAPLTAKAEALHRACRRCLRALGVRLTSRGTPPAHAGLIAPNHMSYLDVLVISALRPVVFVSRADAAGWPVFGWFARKAGTRFIDRAKRADVGRVIGELAPAVEAGVPVVVFLEGTTTDGAGVGPFHASLLAPAVASAWSIAPVAMRYHVPAPHLAARDIAWWGDMSFAPHLLRLLALPGATVEVQWGDEQPSGTDRKELASRLQAAVSGLHAQITPQESVQPAPALLE